MPRWALFSGSSDVPEDRAQSAGQFRRAIIVEVVVVSEYRSTFVNSRAESVVAEKWFLRHDLNGDLCNQFVEQRPRAAGSLPVILNRQADRIFDAVDLRRIASVPHGEG